MYLEQNIRGLCDKFGLNFDSFLEELDVDHVNELSIYDLEAIAEEYVIDLNALLFKNSFKSNHLKSRLENIKLLVLDVDGVMTDGGMYFTESGDQFKKFNTKDGMAILHLTKSDFQVAIISSGFRGESVHRRAEMLGIQHCTVSRDSKMDTLNKLCSTLGIGLENVAMIGDDVNDLAVMEKIGLAACPRDAVNSVKQVCDIILTLKGGQGCVREFIDQYIFDEPLNE
ncbi:MAG: HAD hydrolase family protein [Crocinitomicaceae bacterium]|jgi:YrbI family 3-deoxy-D-manno-octulosonate 8-phosphate phosphatase|nr:HAD hydrolase family protein [Crocinitomicaceae bacterium]